MKWIPIILAVVLGFVLGYAAKWLFPDEAPEFGRFIGRVVGEWDANGRDMTLVEDFGYSDPRGGIWLAPKGSIINGASIPKVFWSVIGGPFEGKFRNASVIHDVACVDRTRSHEAVHRAFYEACRAGGVDQQMARILYAAVSKFGPKWTYQEVTRTVTTPVARFVPEMRTRTIIDPDTGEEKSEEYTVHRQVTETRQAEVLVKEAVLASVLEPTEAEAKEFVEQIKQNEPTLDEIAAYGRIDAPEPSSG
jgi:hypothetical protein